MIRYWEQGTQLNQMAPNSYLIAIFFLKQVHRFGLRDKQKETKEESFWNQ